MDAALIRGCKPRIILYSQIYVCFLILLNIFSVTALPVSNFENNKYLHIKDDVFNLGRIEVPPKEIIRRTRSINSWSMSDRSSNHDQVHAIPTTSSGQPGNLDDQSDIHVDQSSDNFRIDEVDNFSNLHEKNAKEMWSSGDKESTNSPKLSHLKVLAQLLQTSDGKVRDNATDHYERDRQELSKELMAVSTFIYDKFCLQKHAITPKNNDIT